jgi:hypothetical protein
MSDTEVKFRDFSLSHDDVVPRFMIAPDTFRCYPEIPLDVMMDVVQMTQQKVDGIERFKQMMDMLSGVIVAEDWDRFINRTKRATPENPNPSPIGIRHIKELLPWIMEVYGLRPTQESSESADGSDTGSTSSTEPASDTELIS